MKISPGFSLARIDFAMLAAAVVEVPRWAVAFAAIREPMWAAVPMGLLLAWAASAGWKSYFEDKNRKLLLAINATSLIGALVVIAPVLYAMTFQPLDAINLAQVLPPQYLWVWAIVLSITTFVPLIQVAAVKAYHAPHSAATPQPTTTPPDTLTAPPVPAQGQLEDTAPEPASAEQPATVTAAPAPARKPAQRKPQRKPAKLSAAQRQAQIAESGVTDVSAICAQFGVSLRTAQSDIAAVRKGLLAQNGVQHA
jgi:hypothetical protein